MSAPRKWPTPPEQMRSGLAYGRSIGTTFDHAWRESWNGLYWGHGCQRGEWREALLTARPEFEAAWHGRETPLSRTLAAAGHGPADPSRTASIPLVALARVA